MTGHERRAPTSVDTASWIGLAGIGCALTIAACGSSGKPHPAASDTHAQAVRYSNCMRSHGVPDFPDPSPGGGFNLLALGTEKGSLAFLAAQAACARTQPGGSKRPAPFTGEQKRAIVAKARCIRAHGVPNLPDPATIGPGFFGEPNLPPDWKPDAPAIIRATRACAHVGIPIPSPDGAIGG